MLLALLLLLGKPEWRDRAPLAGTYEIAVCTEPCKWEEAGKRTMSGTLVLFARDLTPSDLNGPEAEYLYEESYYLLSSAAPTACFVVQELNLEDESPTGSIPVGLTRWLLDEGIVSVLFWRSVHGSQSASGEMKGRYIKAGKREAKRIAAIRTKYHEFLVGRRTGEPSLDTCIQAARAALRAK
jgi:hypothetical protein